MYPVLLSVGPITLHTYGLMVASGFMLGIFLTARLAKKEGIDPQKVYDISFWIILSAIIGARLFYIIVNLDFFLENPVDIFKLWRGGLVFYGGLIGASIAVIVCAKRYDLKLWQFADIATPGLALGHAVGRVGCVFAGCCYGKATDVAWAITFHNADSLAPVGVPLHPTQLYSVGNELLLFALLMAMRKYKKFDGQLWWTWVTLYAVGRSVIENYRGDPRGLWFDGMISTSQIIAILAVLITMGFFLASKRKKANG